MLLFEMSALSLTFAMTRLLVDIPGIIIIAYLLGKFIPKEDIRKMYEKAEQSEAPAKSAKPIK